MNDKETTLNAELNGFYPVFEANQVLTNQHLNNLRNYLDTQDRISRVKLIGIGIVCGFGIEYKADKLTIGAGTGITSEGFLAIMEKEEVFASCSKIPYADPSGYFTSSEGEKTKVFELIPFVEMVEAPIEKISILDDCADPTDPDPSTIIDFDSPEAEAFLKDKVVLLFVEYLDIDLEACIGENCDEKGIQRKFTLRKFLVSCNDAKKIIDAKYTLPMDDFVRYDRFQPKLGRMKSFRFLPEGSDFKNYQEILSSLNSEEQLVNTYNAIFEKGKNPVTIFENLFKESIEKFLPIITSPVKMEDVEALMELLNKHQEEYSKDMRAQYFYDFMKDIFKAYNEWVMGAFDLVSTCSPRTDKFPRHLFLGILFKNGECAEVEACKPPFYRTQFIQTTIYNSQKDKIAHVNNDLMRLITMIESFGLDYQKNYQLKITPSDEKQHELGARSIPFYYKTKENIHKYWNYNLSKRCKMDWNLGYWNKSKKDEFYPIIKPLKMDKDPFNFYRIEGVLGRSYKSVKDTLEVSKLRYNLDFNIIDLHLSLNKKDENHYFDHIDDPLLNTIQENYLQLRNEILVEIDKYDTLISIVLHSVFDLAALIRKDKTLKDFKGMDEIKNLILTLPKCIVDFDLEDFNKAYKKLREFIFLIIVFLEKILILSKEIGFFIKYMLNQQLVYSGYMGDVFDLYDILRENLDVKMASIYFSFKKRTSILKTPFLLSNFVKNNPGLEHKAGVPDGGTFILVLDQDKKVVADFALTGKPCVDIKNSICSNSDIEYPPIARNVYRFFDATKRDQKINIDVLVNDIDINSVKMTIDETKTDRVSERGAVITVIPNPAEAGLTDKLISYKLTTQFGHAVDRFEYTIINEFGLKSKAYVYISFMDPEDKMIIPSLPKDKKEGKGKVWDVRTRALDNAKKITKMKKGGTSAEEMIVKTENVYFRFGEELSLEDGATIKEKKLYQKQVVTEMKKLSDETIERIHSLDLSIGIEPYKLSDKLKKRIELSDKYMERTSLVMLFENQVETIAKVAIEEKLLENKSSEIFTFINTDLRTNMEKVRLHTKAPEKIFFSLAENETEILSKELYKSFKR